MVFRGDRFCITFVITLIATFGVVKTIDRVLGLNAGVASTITLPLLIAAMVEGRSFARKHRVRPAATLCGLAALKMSAIALVMVLALVVVWFVLDPARVVLVDNLASSSAFLGFVVLYVLGWMVLRFGYSFGLTTELKQQQFVGQ